LLTSNLVRRRCIRIPALSHLLNGLENIYSIEKELQCLNANFLQYITCKGISPYDGAQLDELSDELSVNPGN
jgi:hypothetical protein